MNVIRHDHIGMEMVAMEFAIAVMKGGDDKSGDFRPRQMSRSGRRAIQNAVHSDEHFALSHGRWFEKASCGQAVVKAKRYE